MTPQGQKAALEPTQADIELAHAIVAGVLIDRPGSEDVRRAAEIVARHRLASSPIANAEPANDKFRVMLLELLAVIHGDGGHKTQEIGIDLAHAQAMRLSAERKHAPAGDAELRKALDEASIRQVAGRCAAMARTVPVAGEPDPHWWERQSALGDAADWLNVVLAALATPPSVPAQQGWLPIETAPKDWVPVLVWAISEEERDDAEDENREPEYAAFVAAHSDIQPGLWWMAGGVMSKVYNPTHWMPLPATPPAQDQKGDSE